MTAAEIPSWKFSFEAPDDAPDAAYEDGVLSFKTRDGGYVWLNSRVWQFGTGFFGSDTPYRFFITAKEHNSNRVHDEGSDFEVTKDVYELVGHLLSNRRFNALITAHKSPIKNDENRA